LDWSDDADEKSRRSQTKQVDRLFGFNLPSRKTGRQEVSFLNTFAEAETQLLGAGSRQEVCRTNNKTQILSI
jgi:hypothetical protein